MAVTQQDVLHVAGLARLAVDPSRLDALVGELNGILGHMEALTLADTDGIETPKLSQGDSTPLRSDSSGPIPLLAPLASFAPSMKDGFILVPRLATHEDGAEPSP